MLQRGRKSAASLSVGAVIPAQPTLVAPVHLSEAEAALFNELIADCEADHFTPTDIPLLARYCEAAVLAERAAKELREGGAVTDGRASPWLVVQEKSVRALVALSLRLGLSPQARSGRPKQSDLLRRPWE